MSIQVRRVRNAYKYLSPYVKTGNSYQLGTEIKNVSINKLDSIGFNPDYKNGDQILPPAKFGPVSRFNCNGKFGPAKRNLPKVPFSVSYTSTIVDWHGNPHDVIITQNRFRYQRDFIPPPGIELHIATNTSGEKLIVTDVYKFNENGETDKNVLNLFLEIFGECRVYDSNLAAIINAPINRVQWKFLPTGILPWAKQRQNLAPAINAAPKQHKDIIEGRYEYLNRFKPNELAVGLGGFSDYIVFSFPSQGLWVMESSRTLNATYIFDKSWKSKSMMTKAEVINGLHHKHRIIHSPNWKHDIESILRSS